MRILQKTPGELFQNKKITLIDVYNIYGCTRGLYLEIVLLSGENF